MRTTRRNSILKDRDRISHGLHDMVIQRLFAVGLGLQGASRLANRPDIAARLDQAVDGLDATIKDVRRSIFALAEHRRLPRHPGRGHPTGRPRRGHAQVPADAAVRGPSGRWWETTSRPTCSPCSARPSRTPPARRGASVEVVLTAGDEIVLRVADDGRGLDPRVHESGLRNCASGPSAAAARSWWSPPAARAPPSRGVRPRADPARQLAREVVPPRRRPLELAVHQRTADIGREERLGAAGRRESTSTGRPDGAGTGGLDRRRTFETRVSKRAATGACRGCCGSTALSHSRSPLAARSGGAPWRTASARVLGRLRENACVGAGGPRGPGRRASRPVPRPRRPPPRRRPRPRDRRPRPGRPARCSRTSTPRPRERRNDARDSPPVMAPGSPGHACRRQYCMVCVGKALGPARATRSAPAGGPTSTGC